MHCIARSTNYAAPQYAVFFPNFLSQNINVRTCLLLAQHTLIALGCVLYSFESEVSANNCWPVHFLLKGCGDYMCDHKYRLSLYIRNENCCNIPVLYAGLHF
jgi:hypothetical protein